MRAFLTALAAAVSLAFGVVVAPIGTAMATADPIGGCTTTVGTIIAVDFSHWDGPLVRGCGVNDASGYALLYSAGFVTTGDRHDGPSFVCRLGNQAFRSGTQYPTPTEDACVVTPPTTAYWSYWVAPRGQDSWSYSPRGASSDHPQPGAVELWTFGGTDVGGTTGSGVPAFDPDALRAQNTVPITIPARAPTPTAPTGVATSPANPVKANADPGPPATAARPSTAIADAPPRPTTTSRPPATATTVATLATPTTPASAGTGRVAADHTAPPKIVDALPAVHQRAAGGGSVLPLLVAILLVLALGAAATGTLWRRRRAQSE